MSGQDEDAATAYGCATLAEQDESRVWIQVGVRSAYDDLDEAKRERVLRIMQHWCEERPLTSKMFNGSEGRSPGGTMLKAFKTFKHRLYGFERQIEGTRTFVIVDYDPAKKQDRADPGILKRAKGRVDAFGKEN